MYLIVLSSAILLCTFDAASSSAQPRHPRASDQCHSLVDGPFRFCSTKGGYNMTFQNPDFLTDSMLEQAAKTLSEAFSSLNCSRNGLFETLLCHYAIPQCSSGGNRVYPCKRVCGEFLKQCKDTIPETFIDYMIASCHVLPDELGSSGKCFEPPNFSTNDSIKGSVSPSDKVPSEATEGAKVWPIAVSVVVSLVIVGLIVLIAIWMKWRWHRIPRFGYKKHEEDMAPLETSAEL